MLDHHNLGVGAQDQETDLCYAAVPKGRSPTQGLVSLLAAGNWLVTQPHNPSLSGWYPVIQAPSGMAGSSTTGRKHRTIRGASRDIVNDKGWSFVLTKLDSR